MACYCAWTQGNISYLKTTTLFQLNSTKFFSREVDRKSSYCSTVSLWKRLQRLVSTHSLHRFKTQPCFNVVAKSYFRYSGPLYCNARLFRQGSRFCKCCSTKCCVLKWRFPCYCDDLNMAADLRIVQKLKWWFCSLI